MSVHYGYLENGTNSDNLPGSNINFVKKNVSSIFSDWKIASNYIEPGTKVDSRFYFKYDSYDHDGNFSTTQSGANAYTSNAMCFGLKNTYMPSAKGSETISPSSDTGNSDALATFRIPQYAYDADGDLCDMILKITRVYTRVSDSYTHSALDKVLLFTIDGSSNMRAHSRAYTKRSVSSTAIHAGFSVDYQFRFVKTGTNSYVKSQNCLMGWDDVDITAWQVWSEGDTTFNEGVKIINPNPVNTYFVNQSLVADNPELKLTIDKDNQLVQSVQTGDAGYNDTDYNYHYGFMANFTVANGGNSGGKFRVYGAACNSVLFQQYKPTNTLAYAHLISNPSVSSRDGGDITFWGQIPISFNSTRTFNYTPVNKYYRVVKLETSQAHGSYDTRTNVTQQTFSPTGGVYTSPKIIDNNAPFRVDVYYQAVEGTLYVEKKDKTYGRKLSGAEYTITCVDSPFYENGSVVKTITTDDTGRASASLYGGSFTVQETTSPFGYKLDDSTVREFEIDYDNTSISYINDDSFKNEQMTSTFDVYKTDTDGVGPQGDSTLEGAVFEVKNVSGYTVYINGVSYDNNRVVKTLVSDENGYATTGKILPFGTYSVTEITPPRGYSLEGNNSPFTFTVDGEAQVHTWNCKNLITKAMVEFDKYDSDMVLFHDDIVGFLSGLGVPQGEATLDNARFAIYNVSDKPINVRGIECPTYKNTKQTPLGYFANKFAVGEYAIDVSTATPVTDMFTDIKGHAELGKDYYLPYGTYVLMEVSPPNGYNINPVLEKGVTFTVRDDSNISFTKEALN